MATKIHFCGFAGPTAGDRCKDFSDKQLQGRSSTQKLVWRATWLLWFGLVPKLNLWVTLIGTKSGDLLDSGKWRSCYDRLNQFKENYPRSCCRVWYCACRQYNCSILRPDRNSWLCVYWCSREDGWSCYHDSFQVRRIYRTFDETACRPIIWSEYWMLFAIISVKFGLAEVSGLQLIKL